MGMITWMLLLAAQAAPDPSDPLDRIHTGVYRKVAPATVYVTDGIQEGSGVIIDPSGIILTSSTACGTRGTKVTVTHGHKRHSGRVMGRANNKEMVLVKIDAADLPTVKLGDSDAVRLGQLTYVLGDSFESIKIDGQPAMSMGVVSGIYTLRKRQTGTHYIGKVIETSAAVNPEQDGGPMVDRKGRLLGIITLNYDDSKFTGLAIPINILKPEIKRIRQKYGGRVPVAEAPPPKRGRAWLGAEVREEDGGLVVTRVARKSPAAAAGLKRGDRLRAFEGKPTRTRSALVAALAAHSPGETVRLAVSRGKKQLDLEALLQKKRIY